MKFKKNLEFIIKPYVFLNQPLVKCKILKVNKDDITVEYDIAGRIQIETIKKEIINKHEQLGMISYKNGA